MGLTGQAKPRAGRGAGPAPAACAAIHSRPVSPSYGPVAWPDRTFPSWRGLTRPSAHDERARQGWCMVPTCDCAGLNDGDRAAPSRVFGIGVYGVRRRPAGGRAAMGEHRPTRGRAGRRTAAVRARPAGGVIDLLPPRAGRQDLAESGPAASGRAAQQKPTLRPLNAPAATDPCRPLPHPTCACESGRSIPPALNCFISSRP